MKWKMWFSRNTQPLWPEAMEKRLMDAIQAQGEQIMASIASILAAQQQESNDLTTLAGLIKQLLAAFANSQITPAQAQEILTGMQSEDATITSLSASINATLNPAPPAPTPTPAPTGGSAPAGS